MPFFPAKQIHIFFLIIAVKSSFLIGIFTNFKIKKAPFSVLVFVLKINFT